MKNIILILLILSSFIGYTQPFSYSGYIYNAGGTAAQGVNVDLYTKQTASYVITNPTYNSPVAFNSGTVVPASDDVVLGPYNIGFSFTFFGNTYTQFYICSNGWIGFTAGQTNGYTAQYIPNASAPKNVIMADWEDLFPGSANIYYQTIGSAPNRKLVVSFNNCPHYSCRTTFYSFQFVLYETTNVIDLNMLAKPLCGGNNATQGLINLTGTVCVPTNNRNASTWSISTPETVRFTPSTPSTVFYYHSTYETNNSGRYVINPGLDVNNYQFEIRIPTPMPATILSVIDYTYANYKVLNRSFNALDYYRYDVNSSGDITISDVFCIVMKKAGVFTSWPTSTPNVRLFTPIQYNTISSSTSDLRSLYPGVSTVTITNPINNGSSTYYIIGTGYSNEILTTY